MMACVCVCVTELCLKGFFSLVLCVYVCLSLLATSVYELADVLCVRDFVFV